MDSASTCWKRYRVRCRAGAVTSSLVVFQCWARDVAHAFAMARGSGYTPVSID